MKQNESVSESGGKFTASCCCPWLQSPKLSHRAIRNGRQRAEFRFGNFLSHCVTRLAYQPYKFQWSVYVPPGGHYMYCTVVTICTAQWSLYVPPSGRYMYRTVVTICTVQWSLYVPHSGHYMYRTVVTICTAQWSLYVPHSGHYMYHQFNIQ